MSATKSKPEDLTAENLTQHVIKTCTENVSHERTAVLIAGLIQHLHDYVREVQLKPGEWEAGWQYLTEVRFHTSFSLPVFFIVCYPGDGGTCVPLLVLVLERNVLSDDRWICFTSLTLFRHFC